MSDDVKASVCPSGTRTLDEVATAATVAFTDFYEEDSTVANDILEGIWTEDVVAGLCLVLGYTLHNVVVSSLFEARMDPELVEPLCEQLLAEALGLTS
jgi:hypothetical protein